MDTQPTLPQPPPRPAMTVSAVRDGGKHGSECTITTSASSSAATACDALHELRTHSCVPSDRAPDGGCDGRALLLSLTPPPASDEFVHACALGFVFADEMKVVRQLQRKLREGQVLVRDIYSSRSCARAFSPVAHDADATQTSKYYMTLFTILQPQVEKLKALSEYCAQTVVMLSDNIQRITVHENTTRVIPDMLMDALLGVADVVLQLSQFHGTKSSLRSDFSVFKRAFAQVRDRVADAEQIEKDVQRLQDFVGSSSQSKGSIWDSLRHNLTNVKRFDQVVYLLLKHCLAHIEHDVCVVPDHKFQYVRVLPSLLAVLEDARQHTKSSGNRAAEKRAMDAAVRVLQRFPVVPMFAEVNAMPVSAFQLSNAGTKSETPLSEPSKHLDPAFDLLTVADRMKSVCRDLLPRLAHAINQAANSHLSTEQSALLYSLVLEALMAVNDWKSSLLLFVALKYQFPKSNDALQQMRASFDSPFLEYERMTKYNLSERELSAMVDVVYCVKAVVQMLQRSESCVLSCVHRHVYQRTQVFAQHTTLPLLHRAHKRKLVCAKLLHDVRMSCGDWDDPKATTDDFLKRRKDRRFPVLHDRTAAPTLSQIQMLASLVNAIYAKRSMGDLNAKPSAASSLFSFKKDLDSSDIDLLKQFYREASVFTHMLRLHETLRDLNDFSCLWLRELYLEITKCPQFPTETSLPWMLMEHCLLRPVTASELGLKPVLAVVDIYNDAANCALYTLKRQVLVDEAEAEGKLCFDQLVYTLAHQLYAHYRISALRCGNSTTEASVDTVSGSARKTSSGTGAKSKRRAMPAACPIYEWVAHAKRVEMFGESHNLTHLLTQHVHCKLSSALEKWLSRLEASDATSVLEACGSLDALRRLHAMLSALLPLDGFEDMLHEVDAQTSLPDTAGDDAVEATAYGSRLHIYVRQMVLLDLCQHFSFNVRASCFQRVPLPSELEASVPKHFATDADARRPLLRRVASSLSPRSQQQAAPAAVLCDYERLFGARHVAALLDLLAADQILDIADDCSDFIEAKIEDVLQLCIPALGEAIPPFRFPRFMYRTEGCFGFFEGKFKHVLECEELEAHVFHCLREIGNGLGFLLLLSDAADMRASSLARVAGAEHEDPTIHHLHCGGMFRRALQRLHHMLHATAIATAWHAPVTSHPETIANTASFYHVWSALEFLSCCARDGVSIRDQFGDGVQLAGCTVLHLLGQRALYNLWSVNQHVLSVQAYECTTMPGVGSGMHAKTKIKTKNKKNAPALDGSVGVGIAQSVGTLGYEMQARAAAFAATAVHVRTSSATIFHALETAWAASTITHATAEAAAIAPVSDTRAQFHPPAFVAPTSARRKLATTTTTT